MKKTINVAKALLVLCDKAKNIRVGFYVLLTFNNTFVFLSFLFFIVTWMIKRFPNLSFSVRLMEIPLSLFFTHCRSCIPNNNKTNAVKNVFISPAKFYRQYYS